MACALPPAYLSDQALGCLYINKRKLTMLISSRMRPRTRRASTATSQQQEVQYGIRKQITARAHDLLRRTTTFYLHSPYSRTMTIANARLRLVVLELSLLSSLLNRSWTSQSMRQVRQQVEEQARAALPLIAYITTQTW